LRSIFQLLATLVFSILLSQQFVFAGELEIKEPYILEAVPGAPVAGGYFEIINNTGADERLIGVEVDFAGTAQIHQMSMRDGIMTMRRLADGLPIGDGATGVLAPGGIHVMFMRLKKTMAAGEKYNVQLIFEKAGRRQVEFSVKAR